MRVSRIAHGTPESSVARSSRTKKLPKPSAASSARPIAARGGRPPSSPGGSRAASMIPAIATTMPATWSVAGRSPEASPTSTGTAAPAAETGATMLIVPIASPR